MKQTLFAFFCMCCMTSISAQEFEVPTYYSFEKAEDYAAYSSLIADCADWLISTPLNKEEEKRVDCATFLISWATTCPFIHIVLDGQILTFGESPDLLIIFMAGWVQNSLLNNPDTTPTAMKSQTVESLLQGNMAGLKAVMEFYGKNKDSLGTIENVESYIKMDQKRTLEKFVRKKAKNTYKLMEKK